MHTVVVNPEKFSFKILPSFAAFLLEEKLQEYVETNLQYAIEEKIPLLEKLSRFSHEELMAISSASTLELLTALANNTIHLHIEDNVTKWISNTLEVIDRLEVNAEDITMVAFLRRKTMSCFIPDFTDDIEIKRKLYGEIDVYTTQEELVSYNAFLRMQQEQLNRANIFLAFQESLLLEAQDISEFGSYFVDYENPQNSVTTAQVYKITGLDLSTEPHHFFSNVHPEDRAYSQNVWEKVYKEGGAFDYTFRYILDGTVKKLHSRGILQMEEGKPVSLRGTLRDITKEEELLNQLKESEALHNQAQKLTNLGNWSWTVGDALINWSDEMYRIYGMEPQSEQMTFDKFVSLIHPDEREKRLGEIKQALETGIFQDFTLSKVLPNGETKIIKCKGSVEKDKSGKPVKIVGTCQDITREYHLNNELVTLNNSLSHKNNELVNINRELESFNYIASHDLQEPLRKIQIFAGRLQDSSETISETGHQYINKILSSASRMQQLIADLIEFSQISSPSEAFEKVSLNELVEEVKSSFYESIENGQAIFNIGELPTVDVIPFQFSQLLTNIIGNALKYKRPGVVPEINIKCKQISARESENLNIPRASYFRISICDNGIGFDSEQKDNIFDLFTRLHPTEKFTGTGIGLAICKKIVNNHNGVIRAESEVGKGSCFEIYIPKGIK
ncbi:MAG TPA: PAS domain-containing protein [Flavobacterium sp.]|jgi:PAS domain S-box-containing protein